MNENHRDLISIGFTVTVVVMAGFVAMRFLLPLVWAGVIAIATWPIYKRLERWLGYRKTLVAVLMSVMVTLVVIVPLAGLMIQGLQEARYLTAFLLQSNEGGIPAPEWLHTLPWDGDFLQNWWIEKLGHQGALSDLLETDPATVKSLSRFAKSVGLQVVHRSVVFGFALLCLFFFYRDGDVLAKQINALGEYCLGHRWDMYARNLPMAIKATVNGVVLVGFSVGLIMGSCYAILGVPFAVMLGAVTGVLAMIPFAVPFAFVTVALILLMKGSLASALAILAIGSFVMFVADHFVRPVIIGNATQLPFLAVLFGILGGVESLGLVGLFIGPVVMVLFTTLWHEPELSYKE
jgi:predicted PurR-regulated permease PerM